MILSLKCNDCKEDILQKDPDRCPYCGSTKLLSEKEEISITLAEIEDLIKRGKFEEAAIKYEELGMTDKAKEIRERNMGKVLSINMACPHCGESQPLESRTNKLLCRNCGKTYIIPEKILDSL